MPRLATECLTLPEPILVSQVLAERHLRHFVRQAWPLLEPVQEFVPGWHIDAICEHLEAVTAGQIRQLLICVPPRHMKSLTVSVLWPAWEWGPRNRPSTKWMFASYASSLSTRDSVKCRRVIQSGWYQQQWGQRFRLTGDQNAKERFENDKTGYRLASSVRGAATGEGGDRIVIDDPHNLQEAFSETIRQSVNDWWDVVMAPRRNAPLRSAYVMIMQRCHHDDLAGHVTGQGGWDVLSLPAEFEPPFRCRTRLGWQDPRKREGELLWPAQFSASVVEQLKRQLGTYASAAQLQQRPSPLEGGIVKSGWWRYYDPDVPLVFDEVVQSWDMAFEGHQQCSMVVGQAWGRRGADKYFLDQVRDHLNFVQTLSAMEALTMRRPDAAHKYVENKANGPAVISQMRSRIAGLVPVNPTGGKEARAYAVSPQVESGNVYLPDPQKRPWVKDFLEEWRLFPNGPYTDQVDASSQALLQLDRAYQRLVAVRTLPAIYSETRPNPNPY